MPLTIKVMSFGFKYGVSTESDLVFDVRCLPNPYYIEELRNHTGLEECVRDYVMSFDESQELYKKISDLIDYLIPLYIREGKSQLVIAFGGRRYALPLQTRTSGLPACMVC